MKKRQDTPESTGDAAFKRKRVLAWLLPLVHEPAHSSPNGNLMPALVGTGAAVLLFSAMGGYALFSNQPLHGAIRLLLAGLALASIGYYYITANQVVFFNMVVGILSLFGLYLVGLGGPVRVACLWIFLLPWLAVRLLGPRKAFWMMTAVTVWLSVVFWGPFESSDPTDSTGAFKEVYLLVLIGTTLLCLISEKDRQRRQFELGLLSRKLNQEALNDPLTGLPRRSEVVDKLGYEIRRTSRTGKPLCLMIVDIDHLQKVNTTLGQAMGDKALIMMAARLSRMVRRQDSLARWGSDQFAVLLPETDLFGGNLMAGRIRRETAGTPFLLSKREMKLTVCIGVQASGEQPNREQLIRQAEKALRAAQKAGPNRVFTYPQTVQQRASKA